MKKNQIIIISVVSAIVVLFAIVAVIVFATDAFKSNKTLFYKYAAQLDLKDIVDLNEYSAFQKRLEEEGHGNDGSFTIDISSGQQGEQNVNESIVYNGYTDPANNKSNYDISINSNGETKLEMNYLRDGDLYGLLFKDIVNQYVVVENNNLKDLANKLDMDTEGIPDRIESTKGSSYINYNELKPIFEKYFNDTINQIPDSNYSKIKKEEITLGDKKIEASGFRINLSTNDLKNMIINMLEKAKDDQDLFNQINKVNTSLTFEKYQYDLEELITSLNTPDEYQPQDMSISDDYQPQSFSASNDDNETIMSISVYKKGRKAVKLSVEFLSGGETDIELALEKTNKGTSLKLTSINTMVGQKDITEISFTKTQDTQEQSNLEIVFLTKTDETENGRVTININRKGSLAGGKVTHVISLSTAADSTSVYIALENTTDFGKTMEFQEFTDDNHLAINTLSKEQINTLFDNLGRLISEKLEGIDASSSLMDIFSSGELFENAQPTSQVITNINDQEKAVFNIQFQVYEGTMPGANVKELITIIKSNNEAEPNHTVEYGNMEVDSIDSSKKYKVSFEKDENGYINKANIVESN